MTSPKKSATQTYHPRLFSCLFVLKYYSNPFFRGFDQLSSTIAWRVMVENVHHYITPNFWRARDLKVLKRPLRDAGHTNNVT